MDKEEAIKVIRNMLAITDLTVRGNMTSKMVEACRMAIESLKNESCEVTWVTNNQGEGVAFKDMPIEKVNKILAIMDDEPYDALKLDGMLEDAYEHGYQQARADYETQPCEDCISRADAIRIASGYCHTSNIAKELEKLPSVQPTQPCEDVIVFDNPQEGFIPCIDAVSREAVMKQAKAAYRCAESMEELGNLYEDNIRSLPSVTPSIPTSTDAVSREAVLDIIEQWQSMWDTSYSCIENMPSVQPESRWIPVSERLPQSEDKVLLFYESHYCHYVGSKLVHKGINYFTAIAFYDQENKEWYEDTEWSRNSDVISFPLAWISLPEPYMGGEQK